MTCIFKARAEDDLENIADGRQWQANAVKAALYYINNHILVHDGGNKATIPGGKPLRVYAIAIKLANQAFLNF